MEQGISACSAVRLDRDDASTVTVLSSRAWGYYGLKYKLAMFIYPTTEVDLEIVPWSPDSHSKYQDLSFRSHQHPQPGIRETCSSCCCL